MKTLLLTTLAVTVAGLSLAQSVPQRFENARDRRMRLMVDALQEASLPIEAEKALLAFFDGMSAFIVNQ